MSKNIPLTLMLLLLSAIALNAHAGSVHKWVDAQGVTHYSDQLPETLAKNNYSAVKQIDVLDTYNSSSSNLEHRDDYYSVTNQWARMREERLERKQLQLEKAKEIARQKAAQQPVVPKVVYVNQAEDERSRNTYYPVYTYGFGHHSYGQKYHKKYNGYAGRRNRATCKLSNSNFSRGYSRFGSSRSHSSRSHRSKSLSSGLTLSIR